MHEPLLRLLFPTANRSPVPATRAIARPIDLIITDLFILPPVWEAHKRNILTYLFIPNNLMSFMRYINITMEKIKAGKLESNFNQQINETISLARGLICNSVFELDEQILNELRRKALPGSSLPVSFVAPLMSNNPDHKQNVRLKPELLQAHYCRDEILDSLSFKIS